MMQHVGRLVFALGLVIVSCLLSLGILTLAHLAINHFDADELGKFLQEWSWSTLVAGFLALLGAWATIRAIRDQIAQAEKHAEDARMRKSKAARSSMPFALSSIHEYAVSCASYAITLSDDRGHTSTDDPIELPRIPVDALPVLKECIEHASSGLDEPIARLLYDLQVSQSRMRDTHEAFHSPRGGRRGSWINDAPDRLFDAAQLKARVDRLFSYARQKTEDPPAPLHLLDVEGSLGSMQLPKEPSVPLLIQFRGRLRAHYPNDPEPPHWAPDPM